VFTRPQLAGMLAPIALYPDQLLTQILMAAAYPAEVVEADRWVRDPAHANMTGEALEAALAPIDWDPSVKSLVPFPQVLATMAQHLDWTQKLGEAFLAQQSDVLDAVQQLREQAQAAGYLRSTPQLTVTPNEGAIVIVPANPEVLYVPLYDPFIVYGGWPYAAYPPVVVYRPAGLYGAPFVFSAGFVIVRSFWNWHRCDWPHHRVWVDPPRVNAINAFFISHRHRPPTDHAAWQFDPHHRRGLSTPVSARSGAAAAALGVAPGVAPARSASAPAQPPATQWRHPADPPPRGASLTRPSPAQLLPPVQPRQPAMLRLDPGPRPPAAVSAMPAARPLAAIRPPSAFTGQVHPVAPRASISVPPPVRMPPPAHGTPPAFAVRSAPPAHVAAPPPAAHPAPARASAPPSSSSGRRNGQH
ncbi:MAG TPA: DUF3300 domain-containing protein, partial [Alphaproteobacteria bacterium]